MHKGISLIGDLNAYDDALGVRPYLLDGPHPTTFVSLWALWPQLQPLAPSPFTRAQALRDLGDPRGPAAVPLTALDAQISRANADGRTVALTLYQSFPAWTRRAAPLDEAHVPDDLSPDGPWAWLIAFLCARYGAAAANPHGARVDWLQPMNEPNLTWSPQQGIAATVEMLARTAATVAVDVPGAPGLLLPGTSDVVSPASPHGTPWDEFTDELLARLRGWRPPVPVAWAHHNYADVKHGPQASGRWRAEDVLALQRRHGWPDPSVWLTEGGYQFAVRRDAAQPWRWLVDPRATVDLRQPDAYAEQATRLANNWAAMARMPEVRLWTQYQVNDADVRFQSSLRGPVRGAPHDPPYPAYALWPALAA